MTFEKYVFVSYSTKDNEFLKNIMFMLDSMKIDYWKAPEKIPAGSSYAKEIVRAIEGCGIFLLILSENSQGSIWVEKEIDCALSSGRKIVPFNIDNVSITDSFKFYLNNVQMIFHTPGSSKGFKELRAVLKPYEGTALLAEKNPPKEQKVEVKKVQQETKKGIQPSPVRNTVNKKIDPFHEEPRSRRVMSKRELFPLNTVPKVCKYCGGKLYNDHDGVFICEVCSEENYDDFQRIENYLNEHGSANLNELSAALKLSKKVILSWRSSH